MSRVDARLELRTLNFKLLNLMALTQYSLLDTYIL
jgi:hypothetical protein